MGGETDCYPSLRERRNGYFEALKASGIKNTYSINFNINKANGVAELMELLQVNPQITAIFAVNDEVAVVAIHAIQRMGLRIPEDISVIGYDDTYLAGIVTPKLTTMHVDTVAMGQGAAHLVSLRLHHPVAKRMTLVTHPTLVERDSVARLCK
jgi:DNA-binding LacI/PurR family transcriptional regulator